LGFAEGGEVKDLDSTKCAPGNLATSPGKEKLAKGGVLRRKPKAVKRKAPPVPMPPPDEDDAALPAAGPGPGGPPIAAQGPVMPPGLGGMKKGGKIKKAKGGAFKKGGECVADKDKDKMAAGGAAKQRKGFPNTMGAPKRMASGGSVRGAGAAQRGTNFSGIY
jgi:hypothetical protein